MRLGRLRSDGPRCVLKARSRLAIACVLGALACGCTFATNFARPIVEPPPDAGPDDTGPDAPLEDGDVVDAEPTDADAEIDAASG